jgi:hypothetical protein
MFEESGFCDEVIIASNEEIHSSIRGREAVVLSGTRDESGFWYSAYVPGDKVWRVRAQHVVPTGKRVPQQRWS